MTTKFRAMLACAVLAGVLACAGSASATTATTVCASGCAFTSIQPAIEAAAPGATITIGPGTYVENLVVGKPVTLKGTGNNVIVEPAVSHPVCGPEEGSLCGGSASNVILVQSDNVTITKLKVEGDNPELTSGVVVAGKDIDARNGVITNHEAGTFNDLTVSHVVVADVYLRGIYASSGGSFDFVHDTVENVQGEEESIAMFDFGGSGVMEHNRVIAANDALSANWSTGTRFIGNKISGSSGGVHTDNNGGEGGTADTIEGNTVSACKGEGPAVFVFVPYLSPLVKHNTIKGCATALAAYGGAVAGQGPTFERNHVDGTGAHPGPLGSFGVYLTTDQVGFGFGELTATLTGNMIEHTGTGVFVTQSNPTEGQPAGGQATVHAAGNVIARNTAGAIGEPGTVVQAQENWWGCPTGPNTGHCDTASGTVEYTPWLTERP